MAGYYGYSMSNNAVVAYHSGERPISKWTKADILAALPEQIRQEAKRLTVAELKALCLTRTSWHHTSSRFNRTDFYSISDGVTVDDIRNIINGREPKQQKPAQLIKAKVHYLTWEGTRKHPKAKEHTDYALLKDGWAFLPDGSRKKRSAKGFYIIETYSRAPKGSAKVFAQIERNK